MNGQRHDFACAETHPFRWLASPHFYLPALFVLILVLAGVGGNWARHKHEPQKVAEVVKKEPKQVRGPEFPQWKKS